MIVKNKKNLVKKDIANKINSIIGLPLNLTNEITDDIIDFSINILIREKKNKYQKFWFF